MPRGLIATAVLVPLLLGAQAAHGQKSTEQFIPLGQSPGLSATATDIAAISAVDADNRTITLPTAGGRIVKVTERTRIWLDRSKLGQPNVSGAFEDLRVGRQVEVLYEDETRRQTAEWIKVVPQGGE